MASALFRHSITSPSLAATHVLLAASFHGLVSALLHPTIMVAYLVGRLSDEPRDVALVAVIATATWYIPRLLIAWLASHYQRAYPVVLAAATVRLGAIGILAALVLRAGSADAELVRRILLCYVAYHLASAALAPARDDLIARSAPAASRVHLLRTRWVLAGVSAALAGLVIWGTLNADEGRFPRAFGLLFLAAAMAAAAETWFTLRLREAPPIGTADDRASPLRGGQLREALAARGFRRFLSFRCLLAVAALADPFIIVHGMRQIGAPPGAVGAYVAVFAGGGLLGGAMALDLARLGVIRPVFQVAALVRFAAPLLAVLIPFLAASDGSGRTVTPWLFGSVFLLLGLAPAISAAATQPTLLTLTPPGTRGAALGALNVVLGICALSPLLGSRLVTATSIPTLLIAASALGFVTVLVSAGLDESAPRAGRVRPPITARRQRSNQRLRPLARVRAAGRR